MSSMTRIHFILIGALLVSLSGCASLSPRVPPEPVMTRVQSPEGAEAELSLPAVALSGDILFRLLAADVAVQRQQFALATKLYLMVANDTLDPRLAEQATRMALFARRDREALDAARLWLALVPESRAGREAVITAHIRSGDERGVQEHLEYLLAHRDGDDPEQVFSLIISLLQNERDTQTALNVMRQLVKRNAENPDAQFAFAYVAMQARQLVVARKAAEQALLLRPDWLKAMSLYARVIQLQGRPYEVAVYLAGVVKAFPDVAEMRHKYARSLVATRELPEALTQYLWLLDDEPYNEDMLFVAGLLSLQLNEPDQARELLQRLLKMERRLDDAHFYLAQLAAGRGQDDVAIDHYAEVAKGEHFMDAQMGMVLLLARRGDLLLAQPTLDKLRVKMPGQLNRIDAMAGKILEEDGQLDAAMAMFTAALSRDVDDLGLLYSQALLAERMGLYEQAEKSLLHVLSLDPDNISALNALGFSLADRSTRYQEAYGYIERALELRPHSAAIIDSMGWVLYRLGRLDESLEYLRRSLAIKQDQEVAAHLGEVLWIRGDHSAARSVWRQALDQGPRDDLILDVMKRFEQ